MGKEIERKFLWNRKIDFYSVVCSYPYEVIEDYYFNETTRLRTTYKPQILKKQFITIKSLGMLERDEFEYEIKPTNSPKPLLIKKRYFVPYKEHTFEVNSYGCYFQIPNEDMQNPLRLIEVELQDKDEQLELPNWVGKEVTNNPYFYNYNMFKILQNCYI